MGLFSRLAAFWRDITDTIAPWDDYPTESDPPPEHRPPPSIGDYDPYQAALFAATAPHLLGRAYEIVPVDQAEAVEDLPHN